MADSHIPRALRERVRAQSRYRCGYCLTQEAIVGAAMEIDHIVPASLGGPTVEENLWLACSLCNDYKSNQISARDPVTGTLAGLFDPRRHEWREHFTWTPNGEEIIGLSPIGRATVLALKLNRGLLNGGAPDVARGRLASSCRLSRSSRPLHS